MCLERAAGTSLMRVTLTPVTPVGQLRLLGQSQARLRQPMDKGREKEVAAVNCESDAITLVYIV